MRYKVEYFNRRVLEEIESWPVDLLADYTGIVEMLMEYGPMVGFPHSKALGGGLFEIRPRGQSGIGRAIYCFRIERRIVILHAFRKRTQSIPLHELNLAKKRMKEIGDA